jgi:hypothetical protein
VPFGFICAYPTAGGGDLYGGSLYGRSAQDPSDGGGNLQAAATARALARWGEGPPGREVIVHPVCKGKYRPYSAHGERQYGCFRHHAARARKIQKGGLREGWESFEQWASPALAPQGAAAGSATVPAPEAEVEAEAEGMVEEEDGCGQPSTCPRRPRCG